MEIEVSKLMGRKDEKREVAHLLLIPKAGFYSDFDGLLLGTQDGEFLAKGQYQQLVQL